MKQDDLANFPDWIKTDMGFYKNIKTGESTIWHPFVVSMGAPLYSKAEKWCRKASDDRNKRSKGK